MHTLPPPDVSDFISNFCPYSWNELTGISFTVIGKFNLLEDGVVIVLGEGDPTIIDTSGFHTTLTNLLSFPCEFMDRHDFRRTIASLWGRCALNQTQLRGRELFGELIEDE